MNDTRSEQLKKIGGAIGMALGVIVFLAAVLFAAEAVFHLFTVIAPLGDLLAVLAALSSVGMIVVSLGLAIGTPNPNARGMCAIILIASILITLPLVALDVAQRSAVFIVPEDLKTPGRVIGALLPVLAVAAGVAIVVALSDRASEGKTAAGAAAKYLAWMAKAVGVGASSVFAFYFGASKGIPPLAAVLAAFLLESCFLWAYLARKHAADMSNGRDKAVWSVALLTFGAFIAAVSVETMSVVGGIEVEVLKPLGEIGAQLYVSAVGLTIVLTIAAALLTRHKSTPQVIEGEAVPAAAKVADWLRGQRAAVADLRDAARGELTEAPPRRAIVQTAQDTEAVRVEGADKVARMPPGDPAALQRQTSRTCEHCGKKFKGQGRARFCSEKCKKAAARARARAGEDGPE